MDFKNKVIISFVFTLISIFFIFTSISKAEEISILGLKESIKEALEKNPTIHTAFKKIEQTKARIKVESSLPNPEITISGVKGDSSEEANSLIQRLEIFGQIPLKRTKAQYEYQSTLYQYEEEILALTYEVKFTYFNVLLAEENVRIAEENLETVKSIYKTVEKRFEVGDIPQVQLIKAKVELIRAQQELISQQRELYLAKANFNNLLGRDPNSPVVLKKIPFHALKIPETEELKKLAFKFRPKILSSDMEVKAKESQLKITSSYYLPEAQIAYYQSHLTNPLEKGARFSISFPIFDWGLFQGKISEAESSLLEKKWELQKVKNKVSLEIEEAFLKLTETEKKISSYQEGILKETEEVFNMTQKGYEKGALTFLEVLESQRTLRSVKKEYQETITNYQISLAQLEKAIGKEFFKEINLK